ncbi:MAG TPA: hypothetical protein VMA83_11590 [Solirubrobacteraceae bacterium]|nr:hypothetical protein [Solirubrobacteraceae bacterium]
MGTARPADRATKATTAGARERLAQRVVNLQRELRRLRDAGRLPMTRDGASGGRRIGRR